MQTKAKTIHSWAGIGLANGETINIIQNVANNIYKKKNWTNTNILIIDEISMMSSKILTILDGIAKNIQENLGYMMPIYIQSKNAVFINKLKNSIKKPKRMCPEVT